MPACKFEAINFKCIHSGRAGFTACVTFAMRLPRSYKIEMCLVLLPATLLRCDLQFVSKRFIHTAQSLNLRGLRDMYDVATKNNETRSLGNSIIARILALKFRVHFYDLPPAARAMND